MSSNRRWYAPSQATVVVLSGDPRLADLAAQAARVAGALTRLVDNVDSLDGQLDCPTAVIRGADISYEVDLAITSTWPTSPIAVACLGAGATDVGKSTSDAVTEELPRPSRMTKLDQKEPNQASFALPNQQDDLIQWVETALAPQRNQHRVAVVAASGGIGASTLAVALARQLAKDGAAGASLIDLNPAGTPLTALVGTDPNAPGWAEMLGPDRPVPECQPGGVCLVGGAREIDPQADPARLRQAVEAVEAARPGATTIFDACAATPVPLRRLASWCDHTVLLTRANSVGRAAVLPLARAAQQSGCPVTLVVRPVRGGLDPDDLKTATGATTCIVLKEERALTGSLAQSGGPCDRPHGPVGRVAGHLSRIVCTNVQAPSLAPHRRRGLPGFGGRRNPQPVNWPVADADANSVETATIAKLGLEPSDPPNDQPAPPALGPDGQPEVFAGIKTGPRLSWRKRQDLRPNPIDLGDWTEEW